MPTPKKNESEEDFVARCIPVLIKEGKTQEQAVAQCHSMYRQAKKVKEGDFSMDDNINVVEVQFSTKPWSEVDKSALPASAYLIVGDKDLKKTWHLPYKDDTGKVNIGALKAINVIMKSGQFRGRKLSFRIPAAVREKFNKLWQAYLKQKSAKEELENEWGNKIKDLHKPFIAL